MSNSDPSSDISKLRLAVLMLAAGEGSRLGSYPKAMLRIDDCTLLERFSLAIQGFSPTEYIAVTGFHAPAIESEIAKINTSLAYPIKSVRNLTPEMGQTSSVRLGLESLQGVFDVLLVALSDQPLIGDQEIRELLAEFSRRNPSEEIILPIVNGQRGNPVLFSKKVVLDILGIQGMVCRAYMDAHSEKVRLMQTNNRAYVLDVDTPADIQAHKLTFS